MTQNVLTAGTRLTARSADAGSQHRYVELMDLI